jgi:hypothetical protein
MLVTWHEASYKNKEKKVLIRYYDTHYLIGFTVIFYAKLESYVVVCCFEVLIFRPVAKFYKVLYLQPLNYWVWCSIQIE